MISIYLLPIPLYFVYNGVTVLRGENQRFTKNVQDVLDIYEINVPDANTIIGKLSENI